MAYSDFCLCDEPEIGASMCGYCQEKWVDDGVCRECGGIFSVCETCDSVQT